MVNEAQSNIIAAIPRHWSRAIAVPMSATIIPV